MGDYTWLNVWEIDAPVAGDLPARGLTDSAFKWKHDAVICAGATGLPRHRPAAEALR